jgi:adenylate cyclase
VISTFPRLAALVTGVIAGLLCVALSLSPYPQRLEEELGLRWLFQLRGPQHPPDDVLLIVMNSAAASRIFLPAHPEAYHRCHDLRIGNAPPTHVNLPALPARWPRCIHAALVQGLSRWGAELIVFDVLFRPRPPAPGPGPDPNVEQDRLLGQAIAEAGNVLLAEKLEAVRTEEGPANWQPARLSPLIADFALGRAPVPLIPSAGQLNRFALFLEDGWPTPTLPMVALQASRLDNYAEFHRMLAQLQPEAGAFLPDGPNAIRQQSHLQALTLHIRQIFRETPDLSQRFEALIEVEGTRGSAEALALNGLLAAYSGPATRQLNFYGPSGTLRSIEYDHALRAIGQTAHEEGKQLFRGKTVFVGYSEQEGLEQVEHFPTAVSTASRPDLSGTEILATAYSNLRTGRTIDRAHPAASIAIVFSLSASAAVFAAFLSLGVFTVALIATSLLYSTLSVFAFSAHQIWFPIFASLCIALPLGTTSGIVFKYLLARAQHQRARRVIRALVPRDIADALEHNAEDVTRVRTSLECACVATDAARYTAFAESMATERLRELLNRYYSSLLQPVANRGGFVSDIVGDAMLAIWPIREATTRRDVCLACMDMLEASRRFSEASAGGELTTRFGIELGGVTLGALGGGDHYEVRAVGDPVNTATRLQELNKQLGTQLLVSKGMISGLDEFLVRDLGKFLLRGKTKPVHVFELLGLRTNASAATLRLCQLYAALTSLLAIGSIDQAGNVLTQIDAEFPTDGSARFFHDVLSGRLPLRGGSVVLG